VTTPVAVTTEAIVGALLAHVPPGVALLNVIDENLHTELAPVIGDNGFTVIA
jgi:hypothetical protein